MIPLALRRRHDDLGCAPDLMPPEERERVYGESPDFYRTAGACLCGDCGRTYYDHPQVLGALWLVRLCNNDFVKL